MCDAVLQNSLLPLTPLPFETDMTHESPSARSTLVSVLCGGIVALPAAFAISGGYIIIAELAYRLFPNSGYARLLTLFWFDPGARADITLVFLFTIPVHLLVYVGFFRRRPPTFHWKYLAIGTVSWISLMLLSQLILRLLGPLQSPL
jgi:hypothetical protein